MGFTLQTPAKINLYLKVISLRPDGYHNILSLMQMIGLYDTLTFQEEGAEVRLDVVNGAVPRDQTNLVMRAAHMLQKKMNLMGGAKRGAIITLEKNIPISAGLGGGSSDAAATLMGLNRLWSLRLSRQTLSKMGSYIGSDVPFFFHGPTAWVSGKGEQVSKIASEISGFVLIVYAGKPVSTASVYHQIGEEIDFTKTKWKETPSIKEILVSPENDLEKVTLKAQPELEKIKSLLESFGGEGALMSGSGPTVFARFQTEVQANVAGLEMKKQGYHAVWVAKLLQRLPPGFGGGYREPFSDAI